MLCNWQGHLVRWLFGGMLYGLVEVVWRGYTHWTMMVLAAALCIPLDIAKLYFDRLEDFVSASDKMKENAEEKM